MLAGIPGGQPFESGHGPVAYGGNRGDARSRFHAINQHRAGTALREAASETRSVQLEFAREHIEQWRIRRRVNPPRAFVDADSHPIGHRFYSLRGSLPRGAASLSIDPNTIQ